MSTMRLADYVVQKLSEAGIKDVFMVTGGGAMHLNDAFGRNKNFQITSCHHEQSCAMAAESYYRLTNKLAAVNVTTGPGGINAINGVFGAFTDSLGMIVISGQVKRETLLSTYGLNGKLRQLGDQEVDIISMVKGITKYAVLVENPLSIRYHVERAIYLATHGRPGPVWLDIPIDVQATQINPESLTSYNISEDQLIFDNPRINEQVKIVINHIIEAKRPVILVGNGVRLSGGEETFLKLADILKIPIVTAWTNDLIHSDHTLFCGRQGTIGTRAGNFTVQNADFVLILGCRMSIRQISYNFKSFAHHAKVSQVDIDKSELEKPTFKANIPIYCDAYIFIKEILRQIGDHHKVPLSHTEWLQWCKKRVDLYPAVLPKHRQLQQDINPYHFIEVLFENLKENDVIVCANATACIVPFQAAILKRGQRLFSNSGSASMGYDLPAAIGACIALKNQNRRIICLAGDGSIQMNIQELATIAYYKLPIKLFILSNFGYLSIRSTQSNFFNLLIGESPESGVGFPDFVKVAEAYGLRSKEINPLYIQTELANIIEAEGSYVGVIKLNRSQSFEPKLSSKKLPDGKMITSPLEDMAPFLSREEFLSNMITPIQED